MEQHSVRTRGSLHTCESILAQEDLQGAGDDVAGTCGPNSGSSGHGEPKLCTGAEQSASEGSGLLKTEGADPPGGGEDQKGSPWGFSGHNRGARVSSSKPSDVKAAAGWVQPGS
ncbi:hypothetical protein Efla_002517 [Eimeria flavescens]